MRIAIRSVLPVVALLHPWNVIAQTQAPIDLAEVESDRSRACVARLAALEDFEASLAPYVSRANRLNALGRAITLEKRQDAEPFDGGDPVEASVSQWFSSDSLLASRFLQEGDSTVLTQRGEERAQILERVRQSIRDIQTDAQAVLDGGADVQAAAEPCVGVILIRSAVLEECGGDESSQVCQAAASEERDAPSSSSKRPTISGVWRSMDPGLIPRPSSSDPTENWSERAPLLGHASGMW